MDRTASRSTRGTATASADRLVRRDLLLLRLEADRRLRRRADGRPVRQRRTTSTR